MLKTNKFAYESRFFIFCVFCCFFLWCVWLFRANFFKRIHFKFEYKSSKHTTEIKNLTKNNTNIILILNPWLYAQIKFIGKQTLWPNIKLSIHYAHTMLFNSYTPDTNIYISNDGGNIFVHIFISSHFLYIKIFLTYLPIRWKIRHLFDDYNEM